MFIRPLGRCMRPRLRPSYEVRRPHFVTRERTSQKLTTVSLPIVHRPPSFHLPQAKRKRRFSDTPPPPPPPHFLSSSRRTYLMIAGGFVVLSALAKWYFDSKQEASNTQTATAGRDVIQVIVINERTKAPAKNLSFIDKPNKNFVKREEVDKEIDRILTSNKICYLRGYGGLGKTQLALNYAEENKDKYSHVLFVNCEDSGSIIDSITAIAKCLDPFDEEASFKEKKELVLKFINEKNPYWHQSGQKNVLIILDNIDTQTAYKLIRSFLEVNLSGKIIATGRYDIDKGESIEVFPIQSVSKQEAYDIFKKIINRVFLLP